jgi:hypothetical protein
MYPASRLVRPDPRSPIIPKLLALVAAVVVLVAVLEVFFVLKPARPHLVQSGHRVPSCSISFGGGGDPCHLFVPDQHVALRVGIGAGALGIVGGLMVAASRRSSRLEVSTPA